MTNTEKRAEVQKYKHSFLIRIFDTAIKNGQIIIMRQVQRFVSVGTHVPISVAVSDNKLLSLHAPG